MWNSQCPKCDNPYVPYISGYPSDAIISLDRDKLIKWSGTCIWTDNMPKSYCYACDEYSDVPSVLEY